MSSSNKKQSNNGDKARRGGKGKVSHYVVQWRMYFCNSQYCTM